MRRLRVIGIGVGDPGYVTVQAVQAMNEVDVFFILDKPSAEDLTLAREAICERFVTDHEYRSVRVPDPPRDRQDPNYRGAVDEWRDARAIELERAIATELPDGGCGGFLVWGDPSLYDGTIRVVETLVRRGVLELEYDVIPGVSSIHALAARHRITINRVAGAVHVTTGRRLAEAFPDNADEVIVMLDADLVCRRYRDQDLEIFWGAYLGTEDEALIAGRLDDVVDRIAATRAELRERKGWIMDSYLVRRPLPD